MRGYITLNFRWMIQLYLVDLFIKIMMQEVLQFGPLRLTSFFTLDLRYNRGISFGLLGFDDSVSYALVTAGIGVIILLFYWYTTRRSRHGLSVEPEELILAGGFANFTDRLRCCGVVDYLSFQWGWYRSPVFNFADILIAVGVCWMVYEQLRGGRAHDE